MFAIVSILGPLLLVAVLLCPPSFVPGCLLQEFSCAICSGPAVPFYAFFVAVIAAICVATIGHFLLITLLPLTPCNLYVVQFDVIDCAGIYRPAFPFVLLLVAGFLAVVVAV